MVNLLKQSKKFSDSGNTSATKKKGIDKTIAFYADKMKSAWAQYGHAPDIKENPVCARGSNE